MACTRTCFLAALITAATVWSVNANPILSVTFEDHYVGNETISGLAVRRWHLAKNEFGEPIAFIRGKWHANGANKCAYDAKNEILYIFTHELWKYGPATAEITGVTVNHPVNTVVKRLPPASTCNSHNSINFDSSSGDIIHTCIAGTEYSINSVDTKSGTATNLRTIPMGGNSLFTMTAPGYDEHNQNLAVNFLTKDLTSSLAFVPAKSTDPYVYGEDDAGLIGSIWTGKNDGSMISFGYDGNLTTATAAVDPATNTVTTKTLATVKGDISGIWNSVQTYDPVEDILYAFSDTEDDVVGFYLVGVYGSSGKIATEFKTKSQSYSPVCLVIV